MAETATKNSSHISKYTRQATVEALLTDKWTAKRKFHWPLESYFNHIAVCDNDFYTVPYS